MSRSKIVAGNWKMNNTLTEATALVEGVLKTAAPKQKVETIFFPPFPFLHPVSQLISGRTGYAAGAQNCSEHASGAFTGEVSAAMLASTGCKYVLAGHSERREYFKETGGQLVKKVRLALDHQLTVIFCFGEKLHERKAGSHFAVVSSQLKEVLEHFSADELKHLVLAYEPVWAIGTGETATPAQAQEMHAVVRLTIGQLFNKALANAMPILYGGSCNAQNAKELFACPDVDGGLIGGASLKADDFCRIIDSF